MIIPLQASWPSSPAGLLILSQILAAWAVTQYVLPRAPQTGGWRVLVDGLLVGGTVLFLLGLGDSRVRILAAG